MRNCIMGIDPGQTVGIAWHRLFAGSDADLDEFHSMQINHENLGQWLDYYLYCMDIDLLIYEQFNVTHATPASAVKLAVECIGAIKAMCDRHGIDYVEQTRQTGKNLGTTTRLKKLGWYRTLLPHGNDAARHLLAYRLAEGWTSQALDQSLNLN